MLPIHKRGASAFGEEGLSPRHIIEFPTAPHFEWWEDVINHVVTCMKNGEANEAERILAITIDAHAKYMLGFTDKEIAQNMQEIIDSFIVLAEDLYDIIYTNGVYDSPAEEFFNQVTSLIIGEGPPRPRVKPKKEKQVEEAMACS